MIKNDSRRESRLSKELGLLGVISSSRISIRRRDENSRDRVVAGIAAGSRIGVKLLDEPDLQGGFLLGLSERRLLQALPVVDESPGQRPSVRRILSCDQDDPAVSNFDDDVDRDQRISFALLRHLQLP